MQHFLKLFSWAAGFDFKNRYQNQEFLENNFNSKKQFQLRRTDIDCRNKINVQNCLSLKTDIKVIIWAIFSLKSYLVFNAIHKPIIKKITNV